MKAKPIVKKTTKYYETGGYYESTSCSNCAVASNEYKKICPRCKGTGSVKTNKFIPKGKKSYVEDEIVSGFEKGTNESGFTGLPSGYRDYFGYYLDFRVNGNWWSSTESNTLHAWSRILYGSNGYADNIGSSKIDGLSVRCLRD